MTKLALFWKEVFAHSQVDVNYVISVRHPLSVCESLAKRDNFEFERSYLLWMGHVIASFVNTVGEKCVVVDYDRMIKSPETELMRVANKLNLQVDSIELDRFTKEFLDHKLRHTTYQLSDLALDDIAPPLVPEIYSKVLDVATGRLEIEDEKFRNNIKMWKEELSRQRTALVMADKLELKTIAIRQNIVNPHSEIWKTALLLRRIRVKLFPLGSQREKLALQIYSALKR